MDDDITDAADPRGGTGDDRVAQRADLLAEEKAVGSDDPVAQAAAIAADGDARTVDREAAPDSFVEHRRSEDATPPPG